ncbi:hypothetical protein GUJ93_ZPchr0003g16918 [Zizania palustris]|uniref:Uncharacterized protein n=1 Tax=Zizania palustris TaxID=103762 RepID=A0A8J5SE32_ZIZPA|nr:hypothetical protein GUJ93_ZPchr0003g16918 [Zizania palustris]
MISNRIATGHLTSLEGIAIKNLYTATTALPRRPPHLNPKPSILPLLSPRVLRDDASSPPPKQWSSGVILSSPLPPLIRFWFAPLEILSNWVVT